MISVHRKVSAEMHELHLNVIIQGVCTYFIKDEPFVYGSVNKKGQNINRSIYILVFPKCDQMFILFFKFWPFAAMKISPIMSQNCQSRLSIVPNKK